MSRGAAGPPPQGREGVREGLQGRVLASLQSGLRAAGRLVRGRPLELATGVLLVGGGLLVLAEFLHLYEVERGVVVIAERTGGDHHSYALLVAGIAVIGAALVARSTGAWPPAAAAAVLGLLALAVALIGDLPDATSSGLTADRRIGKAEPAAGLWVELAGALFALGGGAALTLLLRR